MLYDGAGTSAGDAETLRAIPHSARADERIAILQEANEIAVQKFLQRLQEKLQYDAPPGTEDFVFFEGGSGKGAALQQYDAVFGQQMKSVIAVELSDHQYQAQRQHVDQWISEGKGGFTAENTLFIEDPEAFFSQRPGEAYATLAEKFRYILVKGDVHLELERSQRAALEYDAAIFIESIIHMDRQQVVEAVMEVLSEGGMLALTDVGVVSALNWISLFVARLLNNRANVTPNGAEWWQEQYGEQIVALVNKNEDQRETARQLAAMLRDREMFSQVMKIFTEQGGMSTAQALRQYVLDFLLFSSGAPIVTTYDVTLQKPYAQQEE